MPPRPLARCTKTRLPDSRQPQSPMARQKSPSHGELPRAPSFIAPDLLPTAVAKLRRAAWRAAWQRESDGTRCLGKATRNASVRGLNHGLSFLLRPCFSHLPVKGAAHILGLRRVSFISRFSPGPPWKERPARE